MALQALDNSGSICYSDLELDRTSLAMYSRSILESKTRAVERLSLLSLS